MSTGARHVRLRVQPVHTYKVTTDSCGAWLRSGWVRGRCRPQPSGTWYVSFNKMLASCGQIGNTSPAGGDGLGERGGQWLMPTPPSRRRAGGASGKVRREWIMYLLTFLRQFPWWSEKGNYSQRLSRTVMITNGKDAVEKDSCLYWATITSSYLNTSVHTGRTLWGGDVQAIIHSDCHIQYMSSHHMQYTFNYIFTSTYIWMLYTLTHRTGPFVRVFYNMGKSTADIYPVIWLIIQWELDT